MKRILNVILAVLVFTFLSSVSKGQSEMVYDSGTDINVTTGADICADVVTINGTYSGDGTQCNSALPVELSSFSAIVKGDKVELNWQTATEVNNYGFEIERTAGSPQSSVGSQSQNTWEKIGFIQGHGNSNSQKNYSFIDENPSDGIVTYRLKQIDNDGKFTYSAEINVKVENIPTEFALFQNYPNPFNPETVISWQCAVGSHVTLKVFDVLGNEVITLVNEEKPAGKYTVNFNLQQTTNQAQLTSGVYYYQLSADGFVQTKKMLYLK